MAAEIITAVNLVLAVLVAGVGLYAKLCLAGQGKGN